MKSVIFSLSLLMAFPCFGVYLYGPTESPDNSDSLYYLPGNAPQVQTITPPSSPTQETLKKPKNKIKQILHFLKKPKKD
jgi:hypothetical protein